MRADWIPYGGEAYLDFPAVNAWCVQTAAQNPDWVRLERYGQSRHGRPLLLLTLGDHAGPVHERPALWVDGGTHAAEWTGVMAALRAVSRWVEALRAGDEALIEALRRQTIYVAPCVSPDGFQALCEGEPFLRSTLRPPPPDGLRYGLDPGDIDGDGQTRMMRWRHPAGPLVHDDELPVLMRPRRLDDDPASAFFLCAEGRFLEWDGYRWTAAPLRHGLDLNRNFPGSWAPFRMFGMDGGEFPLSEPESRAMMDAVAARPNIAAALTNHTYTGAMLTQPYRDPSPLGRGDIDLMEALARGAVADTGYRVIRTHPDFVYDPKQPIVGVWADTLTALRGFPAYTLELWDPFGFAGLSLEKPALFFTDPDPQKLKQMVAAFAALPGAVEPWRPFEHPQLGPVELGGLDYMRTIRNPPLALLPAECDKGGLIAERLRLALPRLQGRLLLLERAGDAVALAGQVENLGFLPTAGLHLGEGLTGVGVRVRLQLSQGLRLLQGDAEQDLGHLDGWGDAQVGSSRHGLYAGLPARGHRAQARWVVAGRGVATLQWWSARAGRGESRLELAGD